MFSSHNISRSRTLDKAKSGAKATAVLLPLLGLTWSFGLIVFNKDLIVFKYLFAIFNSLQGLMIFFFHVLVNKQVCQDEITLTKISHVVSHVKNIRK